MKKILSLIIALVLVLTLAAASADTVSPFHMGMEMQTGNLIHLQRLRITHRRLQPVDKRRLKLRRQIQF